MIITTARLLSPGSRKGGRTPELRHCCPFNPVFSGHHRLFTSNGIWWTGHDLIIPSNAWTDISAIRWLDRSPTCTLQMKECNDTLIDLFGFLGDMEHKNLMANRRNDLRSFVCSDSRYAQWRKT